MTKEQQAALRAGKSMEEVLAMATPEPKTPTIPAGKTTAPETVTATSEAEQSAEDADGYAEKLATAEAKIAELTAQVAEKDEALAQATAQVAALEDANTQTQAQLSEVAAVLSAQMKPLAVALNTNVDTSKMSASEIVAKHAEMSAKVRDVYKAGRTTASTTKDAKAEDAATVNLLAAAKTFNL